MDEDILPPAVWGDEAIALCRVEPLDDSGCHLLLFSSHASSAVRARLASVAIPACAVWAGSMPRLSLARYVEVRVVPPLGVSPLAAVNDYSSDGSS